MKTIEKKKKTLLDQISEKSFCCEKYLLNLIRVLNIL